MADDYREQHRSEIHFQVLCASCGKRAYYSPVEEYANIEAYCDGCKAQRVAEARREYKKDFLNRERWLIDPARFQRRPR